MTQLPEFDRSPAAREIFRAASLAGVTKESVGEWMNLAIRHQRLGNMAEVAECARHVIAIHETWGAQHAVYACPQNVLSIAQKMVA